MLSSSVLGEVIAFNEEAAEPFSHLTSDGTMSGAGMADGAPVGEGVMWESEFASPRLAECFVSRLCAGGHTLSQTLCLRRSWLCCSEIVTGTLCGLPADRGT